MSGVSTEQAAVQRMAEEYAERGYVVLIQPRAVDLPPFLADYQPDILAKSPTENVLIEVRSRSSKASDRLKAIAQLLAGRPDWRLEVVYVESEPPVSEAELLSPEAVSEWITSARTLLAQGAHEPALLLAITALEASLLRLCANIGVPVTRQTFKSVLKAAFSAGLLETEEFNFLENLNQVRNLVAHGRVAAPLDRAQAEELIERTEAIARELEAGAREVHEHAKPAVRFVRLSSGNGAFINSSTNEVVVLEAKVGHTITPGPKDAGAWSLALRLVSEEKAVLLSGGELEALQERIHLASTSDIITPGKT